MDRDDLRFVLRDATRTAHGRVDSLFGSLDIAERHDYARFLYAHALGNAAVERAVSAAPGGPPAPPALSPLAREDLSRLGVTCPAEVPAWGLEGADADGLVYVIAGTHFGARVLRARWSRSHDRAVLEAGRYLRSDDMQGYWPDFMMHLRGMTPTPEKREAAIDAASRAFRAFEAAFAQADRDLKRLEDGVV